MNFFRSNEKKSVCLRQSICVSWEPEKGEVRFPYRFKFCGVVELPYEPLVGDIVADDRYVDFGEVTKRRIYSKGNHVHLKFFNQPAKDNIPHHLELWLNDVIFPMYEEEFEDNSIKDIFQFWLTLRSQFYSGFGMEVYEYELFEEQFTDKWFPKFEKAGFDIFEFRLD